VPNVTAGKGMDTIDKNHNGIVPDVMYRSENTVNTPNVPNRNNEAPLAVMIDRLNYEK